MWNSGFTGAFLEFSVVHCLLNSFTCSLLHASPVNMLPWDCYLTDWTFFKKKPTGHSTSPRLLRANVKNWQGSIPTSSYTFMRVVLKFTSLLTLSSGMLWTIGTEAFCWVWSCFLRSAPHSAHISFITVGCVHSSSCRRTSLYKQNTMMIVHPPSK